MNGLDGKIALVTGGSRGLGRAISERLAADGALVAVHYARDHAAAEETVDAIASRDGHAFALHAPLGGREDDVERLLEKLDAELVRRGGSTAFDILVHNAAIAPQGSLADVTREQFAEVLAVNTRAPLFLTQAAQTRLRPGGRIIFVSSGVTRRAWPDLLVYTMSKAALDALSAMTAKLLAPRGITVNTVAPGVMDTDMNAGWLREDADAQAQAQAREGTPLGRLGDPTDVADVVGFLASDQARFVTGQWMDATGGVLL